MKKNIFIILGTALTLVSAGCASRPVALAPVGPNPAGIETANATGCLEVFSALSGRSEGNDPTWDQHSDYFIYNTQGKRLGHVDNATGYYSPTPRLVTLPTDDYIIRARARGVLWAQIPVVIEPGRITRLHLDGDWSPTENAGDLVTGPDGIEVGWRATAMK